VQANRQAEDRTQQEPGCQTGVVRTTMRQHGQKRSMPMPFAARARWLRAAVREARWARRVARSATRAAWAARRRERRECGCCLVAGGEGCVGDGVVEIKERRSGGGESAVCAMPLELVESAVERTGERAEGEETPVGGDMGWYALGTGVP
jgi:hypothetical protein